MATQTICSKNIGPRALNTPNRIRKKMTWKKGQEFRPSGQRPWRQKNSKHGKNVVLASCTYGFLKGVSFNRRLLVSWVSLEFWHHSLLIHMASCHLLKITLDKRCLNFCPDHTFLNTEWEKGGNYHHCAVQCTTEQVLSLITLLGKKEKSMKKIVSWLFCLGGGWGIFGTKFGGLSHLVSSGWHKARGSRPSDLTLTTLGGRSGAKKEP